LNPLQRGALGAGFVSAVLLAAAFAFQHLGGLAPCPLCLWQRWPHAIAVALAILILAFPWRGLAALGALAMLANAGLAAWHAGVERGWWPGPSTCTAPSDIGSQSPEELLETILATPIVRCDEISWSLFGLSMAGWNAIACLALAILWMRAYASSSASQ
jgi:disulfide bond formation protein DsbB